MERPPRAPGGDRLTPPAGAGLVRGIVAKGARMSAGSVRVAAFVGVLNERALIAACLDHLRRIGVAPITVLDLGSTDGTIAVVEALAGPDLRLVHAHRGGSDADLMALAQREVAASPADWAVLMDADEFPLPRGGDLPAVLARAQAADVLTLPRYNIALGPRGTGAALPPEGPHVYGDIDLHVAAEHGFRARLAEDPTRAWLAGVPAPKIAVRPGRVARIVRGMHDVHPPPGQTLRRARSDEIVVAHAALTDFDRFRRKIASIRATFDAHGAEFGPNFGWHWRRWLELDAAGDLRAEYDRSVLGAADLAAWRAAGRVKSAAAVIGADDRAEGRDRA